MKKTAGKWNPAEQPILFLPGVNFGAEVCSHQVRQMLIGTDKEPLLERAATIPIHSNKLCSVLDFGQTTQGKQALQEIISYYRYTFLDSGVFGLAMQHARTHQLSHNEALNTPPEQIDGWQEFLSFYTDLCRSFADTLWGYVEVDLGGTERKIKTRAMLESLGLAPIPVWHPLTDGLEYGEYLMKNYDRICVGNLVKSDEETRHTVLRALAKVKGNKREPWVHALGLAPVPYVTAYPINSIDAMTWMAGMMYPKRQSYSLMHKMAKDAPRFYDDRHDYWMAFTILHRQAQTNLQNWRAYETAKRRSVL